MPKSVDHAQRRRLVIAAARRVLARDGLAGLSMRSVATEAGCTTGLVTHYFQDRQDLVSAVMGDNADRQADRARARFDGGIAGALDALAELLPLDDPRADETRVWLAFYAQAVGSPALLARHEAHYAWWRGELADALATLGMGHDEIEAAVERLVIGLNGLAIQGVLDPAYWTPERQRRQLQRILEDAHPARVLRAAREPSERTT